MKIFTAKLIKKEWDENHFEGRVRTSQVVIAEKVIAEAEAIEKRKEIRKRTTDPKLILIHKHLKAVKSARGERNTLRERKFKKKNWKEFNQKNLYETTKRKRTKPSVPNNRNNVCTCLRATNNKQSFIPNTTIEFIKSYIRAEYFLTEEQLVFNNRDRDKVEARQVIMYLCQHHFKVASEANVGKALGNRDRTTVKHGVNVMKDRVDIEPAFKMKMEKFISEVSNALYLAEMRFNNFSL